MQVPKNLFMMPIWHAEHPTHLRNIMEQLRLILPAVQSAFLVSIYRSIDLWQACIIIFLLQMN